MYVSGLVYCSIEHCIEISRPAHLVLLHSVKCFVFLFSSLRQTISSFHAIFLPFEAEAFNRGVVNQKTCLIPIRQHQF